MNRVYKVIWSKAKHCYVVTSEIARSVTKSASSARSAGRKGAAVLAMAALLFTAGGVLGEAANVVTDVKQGSTTDVITVTIDDSTKTTTKDITINNVAHATKATQDGDGKEISTTYAKIADVEKDYVKKTDGNIVTTGDIVTTRNLTAHDIVATGNISGKAISGTTITGTSLNTQGGDISGGAITGTTITGTSLNTQNGEINGGDIKSGGIIIAKGKITGNGLVAGSGAISGGSLSVTGAMEGNSLKLNGGNLDAGSGTITTTGNIKADGTITTKNLAVTGGLEMNHITLGSKTDDNYTEIDSGNVTSEVNGKVGTVEYTAESIFNKDGSSITARTDVGEHADSTGKSIVEAKEISQYLGDAALPDDSKKNVTRSMVRNGDTFYMEDKAEDKTVDGKNKYSTVRQNAGERTVTVTDGETTASTNLTAADIKNTAEKGMISHTAKNLVNRAYENMTNTVGGNLTTTVTGDSSLTAENITNEAKNKITNKARDVETDAASSIVSKVSNAAGSNTSTQLSYQTMEEMSQADGKTASYLRGAVEEKSQLIDGDKKTTIDTIAGQTNTNITEGKNVSNSLQKADQIASSVTDGTNTTVVNQNAGSLASSITDGTGTKVNNSIHWVDGSAQRIEVDDTHFYAETRTAEKAEEALKSGNTVIDIVKDTTTATVSSAVTDGKNLTGASMTAKGITNSAAESIVNEIGDGSKVKSEMNGSGITNIAKDGTITNIAKNGTITNNAMDVLNKGANSVINKVGDNKVAVKTDSVKAAYGSNTYTTWNDKGITSKTGGNMSNSATNITNKAEKKLSNSAADIENKASSSIWNHVGEGYNTSWKMTGGKISESIVNGTASNKENTTAEGTKRIITNDEGTGTYNQTATSNNISLKNAAGDPYFTKSESLNGEKTSVKNTNGSSTINQSAESIVNFVKNSEGTTKTEQSAVDIKNTAKNGTITNDAKTLLNKASESITDKVGKTTVTTTDGLTKLTNKKGTHITEMDYANVKKDLSVEGDSDLQGNATVGKYLKVNGESTLTGDVTMESNATVGNNLTVNGESTFNNKVTITKGGLDVTGDLNVDGNIETHDAVLSADSRQVVTGRQLYQTNERVDRLDNRIKKVGANAAALAALRPGDFNPDDKFSIAAGFGSYRNANAAALGLFYRPNENVLLSLGTSFGDGENMVNAGVSVKFGRGKSMAERRKEMADEVSSMRDEMRSQDERIAELEEMLKKQSELIEKLSKES